MNRVVDKPDLPGGDIDALLGAYFKAELPKPWPAFQPPRRSRILPVRPAQPRPRFAVGSRLALAASVALLLLCGWLLSGKFPGVPIHPGSPGDPGPGKARLEKPHKLIPGELLDRLPDSKPFTGKVRGNETIEVGNDGLGVRSTVEEDLPPHK
jgi:hypothetical protein